MRDLTLTDSTIANAICSTATLRCIVTVMNDANSPVIDLRLHCEKCDLQCHPAFAAAAKALGVSLPKATTHRSLFHRLQDTWYCVCEAYPMKHRWKVSGTDSKVLDRLWREQSGSR